MNVYTVRIVVLRLERFTLESAFCSHSYMSVLLFIPIHPPIKRYLPLTYKTYKTISFIPFFMTRWSWSTLSSSSSPVTAFSCSSNTLDFTCAYSCLCRYIYSRCGSTYAVFYMLHAMLKYLLIISWSFIQLFFIAHIQCTWYHVP